MYLDGFITPISKDKKEEYLKHLEKVTPIIKEFGALRIVESWSDDVAEGALTDFYRAVKAKQGEAVLFSWIEWPSKEVRDKGMKKMMEDERMKNIEMPFDGERIVYGGFSPIWDKAFEEETDLTVENKGEEQ